MHKGRCRFLRYAPPTIRRAMTCLECGDVVVTDGQRLKPVKFCSHRCACTYADRRSRVRAFGVPSEEFGLIDVARRWGWMCAICGWPVDPALRFPDMQSAQVDHIKPLVHGGPHVLENTQLAHRACNIQKGMRDDPDFFLLYDLGDLLSARAAA